MPEYKYCKIKEFKELEPGALIRHSISDEVYMVVNNYGSRVTAVKVADITNLSEWRVLKEDRIKDLNPN